MGEETAYVRKIGTGCIKEGVAHCSLGTSSWISITSKQAIYDEAQRTFNWAHIIPGYILPTGTMQCGGGAYAWYVNEFCEHEKSSPRNRICLYDYLETEIAQSPLGSNGLLFLPYLMGERSPRWNLNARAGFIGIQIRHKKKDFFTGGPGRCCDELEGGFRCLSRLFTACRANNGSWWRR